MATGKEMLTAVRQAIQPGQNELRLNSFDAADLEKLKPSDLQEFNVDLATSELISADLLNGSLVELGKWLGVALLKDKGQKNLIPGEGIRRTAGIWADGPFDPEALVEEIRQLRNPSST